MSEKELAQHIIRLVGGKENIASVQHCATRLRIVVHDKDKINVKKYKTWIKSRVLSSMPDSTRLSSVPVLSIAYTMRP